MNRHGIGQNDFIKFEILTQSLETGKPQGIKSRRQCAKDILVKEIMASRESHTPSFSEKIILESRQEQQRIILLQERSLQEQRQQDMERQFTR